MIHILNDVIKRVLPHGFSLVHTPSAKTAPTEQVNTRKNDYNQPPMRNYVNEVVMPARAIHYLEDPDLYTTNDTSTLHLSVATADGHCTYPSPHPSPQLTGTTLIRRHS